MKIIPDRAAILTAAIELHRRGIAVVPVKGKKACAPWKLYTKTRQTEAEVRRIFSLPGITGVAAICCALSGRLTVRDFDRREAYDAFVLKYPWASKLPTVATARGYHIWFVSDCPKTIKFTDGELRAGAAIVVVPPSVHKSGVCYRRKVRLPAGPLTGLDYQLFLDGEGAIPAPTADAKGDVSENSKAVSDCSDSSEHSETTDWAIQQTLPTKAGERNDCLFKLARALKFNCGTADAPKADLKVIVKRWHTLALPVIATKEFDRSWADFLDNFRNAIYPLGNLVDIAARSVDPNNLPAAAANYDDLPTLRLIGLCAALARFHPQGRFFLSSHEAGRRIGLKQTLAYRLLMMLVADGVIERLDPGNERKASRYRWLGVQKS